MKERERIIIGALTTLLVLVWLTFAVHRSPRFAGSATGGAFAVAGTAFMLVPLAYMVVKRVELLKRWVTSTVPMRRLLTWHVYAGVIGPVLVLIHTGHRFESVLGIVLTALTLTVTTSGFVGRYLMSFLGKELREQRKTLAGMQSAYADLGQELQRAEPSALIAQPGIKARVFASLFADDADVGDALPVVRAVRLAESISDTEFAIRSNEAFKRAFSFWLKFHIVISLVLYVLIALHIWAGIHFGLRWFE